ncbi:hypothetical protein EJ06DRAFT_361093 [Trichodelitschia bisporula]|uniref:Glycosyltransferase family 2 protein n=1 Tax=Trichodelitschia bisporula TaxID=703511 RepID=A0A6G1I0L0_9PEZI|nr:hypothetical protein EJ06DRAFT_361093 [Trichodelitschia bisporula]
MMDHWYTVWFALLAYVGSLFLFFPSRRPARPAPARFPTVNQSRVEHATRGTFMGHLYVDHSLSIRVGNGGGTGASKYLRLLVNCFAYWRYKPDQPRDDPRYTAADVTVVIPSLDGDTDALRDTICSVLLNDPLEIKVVTINRNLDKAKHLAASLSKKIKVLSIDRANKRHQMCEALPEVTTPITIFADDDVYWPPTLLPWMLAPFERERVGGVGTNQRLRREKHPNVWNFLGAAYLIRRNWDCTACTYMDGGLPCLSGRTVAYRTKILQDEEFQYGFKHETWRSGQLNADDDNFLTRWMVNKGWDTHIQFHPKCEVQTTLEDNPKYLKQCLRWARSNWRSNWTSMFVEFSVWRRHPWSTFAVFQTTITSWSIVLDTLLTWLFWEVSATWHPEWFKWTARSLCYLWIFLGCRIVKYLEHFWRYPQDLKYILLIPAFGYFHSCFIKLYAMLTMHVTAWGSREGADANDNERLVLPPKYSHSTDPAVKNSFNIHDHDPHDESDDGDTNSLPEYTDAGYGAASDVRDDDGQDINIDECSALLPKYTVNQEATQESLD